MKFVFKITFAEGSGLDYNVLIDAKDKQEAELNLARKINEHNLICREHGKRVIKIDNCFMINAVSLEDFERQCIDVQNRIVIEDILE